jgi:predicted amino acid dehydrogenase
LSQGTDPPPSILSVFITDNPYLLHYRNTKREGQNNGDVRTHQIEPFTVHFSFSLIPRLLGSVVQLFRDLVIRFMPSGVARMLAPRIAFAFIAHPRDLTDVPRKFPLSYFFSPRLIDIWFKHQWPFVASYITGLKTKEGAEAIGAMLISPPTTTQMVKNPRLGRKRVLQAVKLAEKLGAQIVGLGAFTSIVTRDGHDLLGKSSVGITTGNPHSAAIAVQNVVIAAALTNLSLPHSTVAIVGGAGSMGSACAKLLSRIVAKLILIDIKREELKKVVEHLKGLPVEVQGSSSIEVVKLADVIIAATNSPHTIILSEHLKPGSIVIDAAQPKNVSEQIALSRKDVLVIESAVVETPGINCHFDLGLGPGEALGCLSETMILTAIGWQGHYSVGKADPTQAAQMIAAGRALGFKLAYFRNASGYITDEDLVYVANMRMTAMPYA